ncbi:MerR family transcriptional regulator [Nocardia mangyaensis]|uniref:MerR family transcriptional regulator n=1 Tax=Nocardia mangyaensis TaxID=2213200 RepID=UPI002675376C|nr:MerR family transcriptional regulator [Nocardia mangyaensis]MDO3646724.1 MerR family transcriptional regulator [Nocardia mangyaensis]
MAQPSTTDHHTVGAAARLLGATTRTLHHWDTVGLVSPFERTPAGYRLYTAADLARAHRVLVYRELGVALDAIGALLDAPAADALSTLRRQRDELGARIDRLGQMAAAVDRMIEARESGILLSAEDQIAIVGGDWQPAWVDQAREQWGDTPQWAQYAERAATRSAEDWQRITADTEALHADLAAACRSGVVPGDPRANTLAERHRVSLASYFDCTHAMHVCLGRRYASDPGYVAYYDALAPGLTAWLRDIIDANARANGTDPATATWEVGRCGDAAAGTAPTSN